VGEEVDQRRSDGAKVVLATTTGGKKRRVI
jgi:hypothetical protein